MAGTPGSGGPSSGAYGVLPRTLDHPRPGHRHECRPLGSAPRLGTGQPGHDYLGSYDDRFEARRLEDGSWTVTRRERDHMSVLGTPRDEDEMVLLLAGRQRTHAYPFASQTNVPWIRALEEAAAPFRASWSRHSELPYLAVFNSERSRAPPAP